MELAFAEISQSSQQDYCWLWTIHQFTLLDIIYENSSEIGHTVAAVKINGEYFVLDQLPPIFSLWGYIKYQAEEEGTPVHNITVYEISKRDEFAGVKEVGVINATEIELECSATEESNKGGFGCYKVSNNDMKTIVSDLRKIIDDNTRLNWGYSLSDEYLPRKFESGVIWYLRYPEYWYHPAVHREFARYIFWEITNSKDISKDINKSDCYWIEAKLDEGDTLLNLELAWY